MMRALIAACCLGIVYLAVAAPPGSAAPPTSHVTLLERPIDAARHRRRAALPEARPPLRGYVAPLLQADGDSRPWVLPADAPAPLRAAADVVARRLARDGLLPTLARVLEHLGPAAFRAPDDAALNRLRAVGLPVDLIGCFVKSPAPSEKGASPIEQRRARALSVIADVAAALLDGPRAAELTFDHYDFRFIASHAGFRVATEDGRHDIALLRLQLTRDAYWQGAGAGGALDVARQLVERMPDTAFFISIERRHLDGFLRLAADWPIGSAGRAMISPEPWTIAQWAQDNGKPGFIGGSPARGAADAGAILTAHHRATLIPRFASRTEEASLFVPGENFLLEGLAEAGHRLIHSPLLFQGGDLLVVHDAACDERVLLMGEAEVHRNIALGLSSAEVLDAFAAECGADRCVVLPAVSFHIDFEVLPRATAEGVIAFVNDEPAAVRIVLGLGLDALQEHGCLAQADADRARSALDEDGLAHYLATVIPALQTTSVDYGRFPMSLARHFARGEHDSPVGNLQRFLMAVDLAMAWSTPEGQEQGGRHAEAYIRAIKRRRRDRARLVQTLADLGWRIVAVPGMPEAERGIVYLNGLQARDRYWMSAYGGFFAPLDQAAADAVSAARAPAIEVIPILCGETQRRQGGLHCAVSVYPK